MKFKNRAAAGRQLAEALEEYRGADTVIIGLPRGGMAVARPVADALGAPLDFVSARKLGAPGNPEYAIGAVTAAGTRVLNSPALRMSWLPPGYLEEETARQRALAVQREAMLREVAPAQPLEGQVLVVVDDGVATGMTMFAALAELRTHRPKALIAAAPVIAPDTFQALERVADRVVALGLPADFSAVGLFYDVFDQVTDEEARALLALPVGS